MFFLTGAEILDKTEEITEGQEEWESCSEGEDEDDSESEWIDVHHSSDDEQVSPLTYRRSAEEKFNIVINELGYSNMIKNIVGIGENAGN